MKYRILALSVFTFCALFSMKLFAAGNLSLPIEDGHYVVVGTKCDKTGFMSENDVTDIPKNMMIYSGGVFFTRGLQYEFKKIRQKGNSYAIDMHTTRIKDGSFSGQW